MGMDEAYYQALHGHREQWRQAGWRHWMEQAVRFEVAATLVRSDGGGDVECLDVGCAHAEFARYLRAHPQVGGVRYVGVDRLEMAGQEGEDVRVLDFAAPGVTLSGRWTSSVAIGAAIDGTPRPYAVQRIRHVRRMWEFMLAHSQQVSVSFLLRDDFAKDQAALGLEDALWGVSLSELRWAIEATQSLWPGWDAVVHEGWVPTDWVVVWHRGGGWGMEEPMDWGEKVLGHPCAQGCGASDKAWLWWFLGQRERGLAAIEGSESLGDRVLRARLSLLT